MAIGDPIAEVETDKVQTDLEAPVAGVLTKHVAELDEAIRVGDVVAIIEPDDG